MSAAGRAGLPGKKYGCGIGYCAACTVLIDGRNTKSSQTPAERAVGTAVNHRRGRVRDDWTAILYDTGTYKAPWIR